MKKIDDLIVAITFVEAWEYDAGLTMVGNRETDDVNLSADVETVKVIF